MLNLIGVVILVAQLVCGAIPESRGEFKTEEYGVRDKTTTNRAAERSLRHLICIHALERWSAKKSVPDCRSP